MNMTFPLRMHFSHFPFSHPWPSCLTVLLFIHLSSETSSPTFKLFFPGLFFSRHEDKLEANSILFSIWILPRSTICVCNSDLHPMKIMLSRRCSTSRDSRCHAHFLTLNRGGSKKLRFERSAKSALRCILESRCNFRCCCCSSA